MPHAWLTLLWLSFRRLLWSATTFMVLCPLLGAGLFLWRWRRWLPAGAAEFEASFNRFTDVFVVSLFTIILLPICALAYATTSLGGDREERTLVFLLTRPVPRWLILLAKLAATLPLVMGLVGGSFYIYCQLAGPVGRQALAAYLPAVFFMTLAYVCLFHLFAVAFRHATIVALIYALFVEPLVIVMPGVINRLAISFYGLSMMRQASPYHRGGESALYEPLSPTAAAWILAGIAAAMLAAAMYLFARKEYQDLT